MKLKENVSLLVFLQKFSSVGRKFFQLSIYPPPSFIYLTITSKTCNYPRQFYGFEFKGCTSNLTIVDSAELYRFATPVSRFSIFFSLFLRAFYAT